MYYFVLLLLLCYLSCFAILKKMSAKVKADDATLTTSPPSKKSDETPLAKQISPPARKDDEATVAFWRIGRSIRSLPLDIRLQILFWWLLDHLTSFEYAEEVSALFYFLLLSKDLCLIRYFLFFSSCTSQKTCLSLRGSISKKNIASSKST